MKGFAFGCMMAGWPLASLMLWTDSKTAGFLLGWSAAWSVVFAWLYLADELGDT